MRKEIVREWKLNWNTLLIQLIAMTVAFALGVLIVSIIVAVELNKGADDITWFCMGTLFTLISTGFILLVIGVLAYTNEFSLHLSMGGTRRSFLVCFALRYLVLLAAGYVLVRFAYVAEQGIYYLLFPGVPNDADFSFLKSPYIPMAILPLVVIIMFLGALRAKFGNKGLFLFWMVYFFCTLLLPRMFSAPDGSVLGNVAFSLVQLLRSVPTAVWIPFGVLSLAAMAGVTVFLGMKQSVQQ